MRGAASREIEVRRAWRAAAFVMAMLASPPVCSGTLVSQSGEFKGGLDPAIFLVTEGGYWKDGGMDGNFRIVVVELGQERLATRSYLQWIGYNATEDKTVEASTVPVKELNELVGRVLEARVVQADPDSEAVAEFLVGSDLPGRNGRHEEMRLKFRLGKPGIYETVKASENGNREEIPGSPQP